MSGNSVLNDEKKLLFSQIVIKIFGQNLFSKKLIEILNVHNLTFK